MKIAPRSLTTTQITEVEKVSLRIGCSVINLGFASAIVDSMSLSPGAQTKIQSLAKLVATNKITLQTAEKQIKESDHEALQGTIISYSGNSRR